MAASHAAGNSMVRRAASKNAMDLLDELDPDQAHRARRWGTLVSSATMSTFIAAVLTP